MLRHTKTARLSTSKYYQNQVTYWYTSTLLLISHSIYHLQTTSLAQSFSYYIYNVEQCSDIPKQHDYLPRNTTKIKSGTDTRRKKIVLKSRSILAYVESHVDLLPQFRNSCKNKQRWENSVILTIGVQLHQKKCMNSLWGNLLWLHERGVGRVHKWRI